MLEIGADTVEEHVLARTAEIEAMLTELGWTSLRTGDRKHWSGILIATSGGDDKAVHATLMDAGVRCSLRGGGVRFAPHYYNSSRDTERIHDILR